MKENRLTIVLFTVIFVLLCCLLLTTNSYAEFNYYGQNQGGFFSGLWDGLKSPVTITLNVFWDNINVYNINNNGFMYNLGFFILALTLSEITIPLFILAWIIKIVFFVGVILIALISKK